LFFSEVLKMYFQAENIVWRRGFVAELLATLATDPAAALAPTPVLHLFTGSLEPDPGTLLAAFTAVEATFTGYAEVTLPAWVGAVNILDQVIALISSGNFVVGTPVTIQENITGYWVDYDTASDWLLAERFPAPFPMVSTGDFLQVDLAAGLPLTLAVK